MINDKPRLILLPGSETDKPEALAAFWERLTGERVTPEILAELRRLLEDELGQVEEVAIKISPDGREWLNDPGDERDIPLEEQFETSLATGGKPEDYAASDPQYAERYRKWLLERNGSDDNAGGKAST